jgi:superfamily I DNA and RNA helicase
MLIFAVSFYGNTSLVFQNNHNKMQNKYIKVTEKDKNPFIVLASNEAFYKNRGATIEEPAKEEIEKAFPEEAVKKASVNQSNDAAKAALAIEKSAHEETKQKLEAEILAHNETKQSLDAANTELTAVKSELEKAIAALNLNAGQEKPSKA